MTGLTWNPPLCLFLYYFYCCLRFPLFGLYILRLKVACVSCFHPSRTPTLLACASAVSIFYHSVPGLIKKWIISTMSCSPNLTFCQHWNHIIVQSLILVWLFVTPWTAACQASLSFTIPLSFLKHTFIESVMPSNHLIFCCPLLLLSSIFPIIRVLFNESPLHIRWSKYWSFSISPSNEYSGLISFRIDWLDLLPVQWTLKSLLQHHSSKASILWRSAFFVVQLSNPYMTAGKTIALTLWTFDSKVVFMLFNMLFRFVIALFQGSKHLFNFMAHSFS